MLGGAGCEVLHLFRSGMKKTAGLQKDGGKIHKNLEKFGEIAFLEATWQA